MSDTLYIQTEQNVEVHHPHVYLQDIAKLSCSNSKILNRLRVMPVANLDPDKLGALVWKYKPAHMFGVPTHYQQLAADPLLESPAHALLAAQVQQMFDKAGPMN